MAVGGRCSCLRQTTSKLPVTAVGSCPSRADDGCRKLKSLCTEGVGLVTAPPPIKGLIPLRLKAKNGRFIVVAVGNVPQRVAPASDEIPTGDGRKRRAWLVLIANLKRVGAPC
jgi:hypothetical protein